VGMGIGLGFATTCTKLALRQAIKN